MTAAGRAARGARWLALWGALLSAGCGSVDEGPDAAAGARGDGAVNDGMPGDGIPDDGIPDDSIPDDGIPDDGIPDDGIPDDDIPDDGIPDRGSLDAAPPDPDGAPDDMALAPEPDRGVPDAALGPVELSCVADFDGGEVIVDVHSAAVTSRADGLDVADAHLWWAHAGEVGEPIAALAGRLTDGDLPAELGGVDGLRRLLEAGGVTVELPALDRRAAVRCPRPDRPALAPWSGWRYDADFDGDGAVEQHAWDIDFHPPWVPSAEDARVVGWTADPTVNRANIVAALRSGAPRVLIEAPPEPGQVWAVDNQIPIIKAYGINAPDGLELLFDEGITFEAADAPYFHDDAAKLLSVDEMRGLRLATVDTNGDGVVEPATLRMRRDLYDPASPAHDPAYGPSESRHVLRVFRSGDVLVQDLRFVDSGGDGIYLGAAQVDGPDAPHTLNHRVTLRRIEAARNYRQGMTVTGVWGLRVDDSVFRDTQGTSPSWGIDFEPNHAFGATRDVVIRGSRFVDNGRAGIGFAMGHFTSDEPIEVAVLDSEISGAAGGSDGIKIHNFDDGRVADLYFRGLRIHDLDFYGVFLSGKNGATARVTFEDCVLRDTARRAAWPQRNDAGEIVDTPTAPVMFTKAYVDRYVGGVRFVDVTIYDDAERPAVRVLPRGDGLKAVRDVVGRLFVGNPHGATIDMDGRGVEPNVGVDVEVVSLGE